MNSQHERPTKIKYYDDSSACIPFPSIFQGNLLTRRKKPKIGKRGLFVELLLFFVFSVSKNSWGSPLGIAIYIYLHT